MNPYQQSRDAGYSDDEIIDYLSSQPKYSEKINKSRDAGYSNQEIASFLSTYNFNEPKEQKPKRSNLEKGARIAGQYVLGAAESAMLPYEISTLGIDSRGAQVARTREDIAADVEDLYAKKASGDWTPEDESKLAELTDLYKNPQKLEETTHEPLDISVRGLTEKATGLDLHPEGVAEHAANWAGFIKDPSKIYSLAKDGLSIKNIIKAISPTGKEALEGLGAGTALAIAEDGGYGPIGTMAAAIVGASTGHIAGMGASGVKKLVTEPKKTLAEVAAKFTSKDKKALQQELIKDFRESGLQADIGTLTDNELVKWTQAKLGQSGLTGKALDDLRTELTNQIKNEYKAIAESLGELKYATLHEGGEVAREGIKKIRDADLSATRQLYKNANESLKEGAAVDSRKLASAIERLEKELTPGAVKSTEQNAVINVINKIKNDIYSPSGKLKFADVKELMNNKIALNDIINYEVQGGAKQLLKGIVGELDRAIISHGKENVSFVRNYVTANKRFAEHAKTFRNKNINQLLNAVDPATIMNKMNSVQGIRDIGKILNKTPEGKEIFNNIRRLKLEKVIGDNLIDSTTQQVRQGTFSKLLEKGKNREIVKEILGNQAYKRLEKLQKNVGKLAETAQKFFNASKSGSTVIDAMLVGSAMHDIANLLAGNPWPIAKTAGGLIGGRKLTNLIADAEFLKLVEEAILASDKNDINRLMMIGEFMEPKIRAALMSEKDQSR